MHPLQPLPKRPSHRCKTRSEVGCVPGAKFPEGRPHMRHILHGKQHLGKLAASGASREDSEYRALESLHQSGMLQILQRVSNCRETNLARRLIQLHLLACCLRKHRAEIEFPPLVCGSSLGTAQGCSNLCIGWEPSSAVHCKIPLYKSSRPPRFEAPRFSPPPSIWRLRCAARAQAELAHASTKKANASSRVSLCVCVHVYILVRLRCHQTVL